ncbi:MAG: tryptophan--tRNA ligase, partial [Alphaproteobacteria bacterium]|nr:tryptophan--tRNA ligase [Alphaproteobacteria bacterium]
AKKIRKAKSDPQPFPTNAGEMEGRPEVTNLVTIYSALSGETPQAIMDRFGGGQFSPFKEALAEVAVAGLTPIATRFRELLSETTEIDKILKNGAEKADAIAQPVIKEAFKIMGFWQK